MNIPERIKTLESQLDFKKDRYMKSKYSYEAKQSTILRKEAELDDLVKKIEIQGEAITVLNSMGDIFEQNSIRSKIEQIISQIVQVLFHEKDFQFRFVKKIKKNQQELYLETSRPDENNNIFFQDIDCVPGGHSDIIDIIIRILVLKGCNKEQRVLILDEPFKNISHNFRIKFFRFFKQLCEKFDIQLNLVSHETEYISEIDNSYKFTYDGVTTKVERVENES